MTLSLASTSAICSGAQYLDLIFLDLWRRMNRSNVPSERAILYGALQHEAQDLVSMTDRAS